ncbi:uncharacterized protein [Paramormyrops kingsleyae]|uniref:uncharacterized protein isoform X1 n=1 Tax=Paramormyrops kingsleyae TaxID=1676925 RepID=UPI003B96C115
MAATHQADKEKIKQEHEATIRETMVNSAKVFVTTSWDFIHSKMDTERGRRFFKEILHSIFFHCHIYRDTELNRQSINPEEILGETLQSELAVMYPDVFESYTSLLPRRSPFSILLEVVVETMAGRSEIDIRTELEKLNNKMIVHKSGGSSCGNDFCFGATVVSYSYFRSSSLETQKYFGASMSCSGRKATRIFISVACIETWNDNVAHAVCLAAKGHPSITLPDTVYSTAYRLHPPKKGGNNSHEYKELSPCELCLKIFPNVTFSSLHKKDQDKQFWNYGNCAECEAISNLLNGQTSISDETQELNASLEHNLEDLRAKRKNILRGHLNRFNFTVTPEARFYNS